MFTKILYDLIYMIPLFLAVLFLGEQYVDLQVGTGLYVSTGVIVLILAVIFKTLKSRLRFLIPLIPSVFGLVMILIRKKEERLSFILENRWFLWVLCVAFVCFFAGILVNGVIWAGRFAAVSVVGILLCGLYGQIQISKKCAAVLFFLLTLAAAEEIQLFWKKGGYTEKKAHLVSIAPFLLLTGLFVFAIPAPEKPYDWQFAVDIWNRIAEGVKKTERFLHRGREDYAGVIGFSDEERGRFSDSLKKESKQVMKLTLGMGTERVIYLRGKVLDTFDGQKWSDTYTEENRDFVLDSVETLCAVSEYDGNYLADYLYENRVQIRYEDFNTKYLFAPLKMIPEQTKKEEWYAQKGGSLLSSKTLGYGTEYQVSYLRMNQEHEIFRRFLEADHETDPVWWAETVQKYANEPEGVSFEDYLLYRKRVYEIYLPQTVVSPQTQKYLDQLFSDAGSDYEKLLRIERILGAFAYTDTPGRYPEEIGSAAEFLDYFLFRKQEGYCSYFATAFVLLARSEGIPARYVQGYYVTRGEGENVTVTSDMSHAWPEAYLDGIGWIPFEPTPGKKTMNAWAVEERAGDVEPGAEKEGSRNGHGSETLKDQETELTDPTDILLPELLEEESINAHHRINWFRILAAAIISILTVVIFIVTDRMIAAHRYRRMDNSGKMTIMCRNNFKYLKFLGYTRETGETLQEFRERISLSHPEYPLRFIDKYELMVYGEKKVTEEMRIEAEEDNEKLKKTLRSAADKRSYCLYKIIKLFI